MALEINDLFDDLRDESALLRRTVDTQRQLIQVLLEVKRAYEQEDRQRLPDLEREVHSLLSALNEKTEKKRKKRLTCPESECLFTTTSKQCLDDHANSHAFRFPFGCDQCEKRFQSRSSLRNHKRYVHSETTHSCSWHGCEFSTRFKHRLLVHQNVHLEVKPFACDWPGCDFSTNYQDKLKFHKHRHTGEKSFACTWPECEQRFRERSHLTVHMLKHTREKPWPCVQCDSRFQTKQSLTCHVSRKHK